ncbi:DUF1992 domain-containing protein [Leifsonia sp. NPDC058248]|uniref:DnaJ family domain-containing protein n=1 Tax=Leifsonia sp. NPDC058248 TaxID=3346402 RepID=UPI0036DAC9A7
MPSIATGGKDAASVEGSGSTDAAGKSRLDVVAGKKERSDSRLNAARYQVDRLIEESGEAEEDANAGQPTMEQRAQFVELSIVQAMRRGDFDNLPGAGKPLQNLRQTHDPNWWIRQKIERERLTGLGPPALTLRTEDAELNARLDAASSEHAARELLEDFNRRVVEARRQLRGGPPVVTPTRDIEEELAKRQERRTNRYREQQEAREREEAEYAAMSRRERRLARRRRDRG